MTFKELITLCKPVEVSGPEPDELGMLCQDSRKVKEGDVFIAIRGFQADGHLFVEDAIDNGASVVISEEKMDTGQSACSIRVSDTRRLLGPLAQAFEGYPADQLRVIGVTGTNGKTTVSTLTYQVLRKLGVQAALLGTVAKHLGQKTIDSKLTTSDPIVLASDMKQMVTSGVSHLVMEVSSHALDQQRVEGISFDVAAFTNLSHDHLDYHDSLNDYARAKKSLFDSLDNSTTAIINGDDDQALFMISDCPARIITFSFKKALDIECQILANSTSGLTIRIGKTLIESPLLGVFNAYNLTEAFLICRVLGVDEQAIADALQEADGAPGRLERITGDTASQPTILVDYAHTPDALANVLQTLKAIKTEAQELHVLFGCGGNRDQTKRPKMATVAEQYADEITVTSDNPRDEDPEAIIDDIMAGFEDASAVHRLADRREAIRKAIQSADKNSIVLVAGKGHETYQEIKGQRLDFDDRQIAREALDTGNDNAKSPGA
ncbi:UDP-N-acetylmuramoyl-L-alanyl-D-glutamate--2,6-diaminopimelate ligase [Fodinibius sediminis]|uniref:UDP-N-acetylmuramoyl-L-alanyl-D-glutamate--2,6-diaminopimelate ligase n=1 Tax=Fodinibius sediminis TaxID=1214077 RepID=A0A521C5K2_9BACT|nr:UDP-N-acetylmuramoyl-L-alanyl-D-glutamate--2,6-diaminopimelate ligase [Fodinibius sediminis]SMO54699.1 UDP-N-acetylmuramoylalanyl-D-glutamate--2,6-diaminopimelate ligase [Fodinibius sediminis]